MAEVEAVLMIDPPPPCSIAGMTCLQVRNTLFRLKLICRSQASSERATGPPAADVVDQHVDFAERVDAGLHHGGNLGAIRHVAGVRRDLAPADFEQRITGLKQRVGRLENDRKVLTEKVEL
jgi:hypothetical protein